MQEEPKAGGGARKGVLFHMVGQGSTERRALEEEVGDGLRGQQRTVESAVQAAARLPSKGPAMAREGRSPEGPRGSRPWQWLNGSAKG